MLQTIQTMNSVIISIHISIIKQDIRIYVRYNGWTEWVKFFKGTQGIPVVT